MGQRECVQRICVAGELGLDVGQEDLRRRMMRLKELQPNAT